MPCHARLENPETGYHSKFPTVAQIEVVHLSPFGDKTGIANQLELGDTKIV
jgi:hypothetical protein